MCLRLTKDHKKFKCIGRLLETLECTYRVLFETQMLQIFFLIYKLIKNYFKDFSNNPIIFHLENL